MTATLTAPPAAPSAAGELELTVVMPCLNEERTVGVCVGKAVRTMAELGVRGEVLVVDNGSTDRSVEVAERAGARVVRHDLKGYGNALRRGFQEARGRFIVMGDADDSYDFTDLGRFVTALRGGAELVMGNRMAGEIKPRAMPWLHRYVGNPGLSWVVNAMFRPGAGDVYCGMRGFRRDAVPRMNLQMPGMELAPEMVIKSKLAGLRVEEIPITLWPDGRGRRPHLRSFRDGWRGLRFMLMCSPLFLFVIPGLTLLAAGLVAIAAITLAGYGTGDYIYGPNMLFTAALASLAGWHVLVFGLLAKAHSHLVDPVFRDPNVEKLLRAFRLERGLAVAGVLMLTGLALGVPVFAHWVRTFEVPRPGQWVASGTVLMLGLEVTFLAFLVGILDLPRERDRLG